MRQICRTVFYYRAGSVCPAFLLPAAATPETAPAPPVQIKHRPTLFRFGRAAAGGQNIIPGAIILSVVFLSLHSPRIAEKYKYIQSRIRNENEPPQSLYGLYIFFRNVRKKSPDIRGNRFDDDVLMDRNVTLPLRYRSCYVMGAGIVKCVRVSRGRFRCLK